MEKNQLPPLLETTLDANLSLGELLQAHMAFACDTTGATAGLLVRQIAANLHVDPRTVNNWLKGRYHPRDEMIQDLVETLAKLIPVPQDRQDRTQLLEKQRKAIHAACHNRGNSVDPMKKISEGTEEKVPTPPRGDLGHEAPAPVLRVKRKHTVFFGAAGALALFSAVWATVVTSHAGTEAATPGNAYAGNSVLIGGFEEPALTAEKGSVYFPKAPVWKTWGRNGGGIQRNGSEWGADLAPEGVQTVFMHSGDVHMSREIRIEPGTYNISLYAARRHYGQENPNPVQILINGKEYSDLITPKNTHFEQYHSHNFTVSAAAVYTIEIATRSRQARVGDTFLDKVELNSVAKESGTEFLKNPFDVVGGKLRSWGGAVQR